MLLLTFTVSDEPYGVDVADVIEVVPRVELRAVPHAPGFVAGLLSYRGKVVPVVDLGLLLGSSPSANRLSTRIILVKMSGAGQNRGEEHPQLAGLIAEHVIDLTTIDPAQVERAPVQLPRAPYLATVARLDQGFVPMIAVDRLASIIRPDLSNEVSSPTPGIKN